MPKYAFSQAPRVPQEKPKYDFYENALFLDDPIQANNSRRPRVCAPKIGTEPRMQSLNDNANPGPQYLVKDRPEFVKVPEYTFGWRRGGAGPAHFCYSVRRCIPFLVVLFQDCGQCVW